MAIRDQEILSNLVEKAKNRDESAFAKLTLEFQNMAFAYALGKLGDYQLAEDAVQESFITVYYGLNGLVDNAAFPGWLRTITDRQCNRYLRSAGFREKPVLMSEAVPAHQDGPDTIVEKQETSGTVLEAVMNLAEDLRQVVLLYYLEGHSQKQVAAFLNVPVATVNNRLHAARSRLKRSMIAMVGKEINTRKLDAQFAENIGKIVKVRGPFVDVQLNAEQLPQVLDSLKVVSGRETGVLSVTKSLGQGKYRCVTVNGKSALSLGNEVVAIESDVVNQVGEEGLTSLVDDLKAKTGATIETGIKAIDLLSPVIEGGVIGVFGIQGVGKAILIGELVRRLAHHPKGITVVGLMRRNERAMAKEMLQDSEILGLFEEAGQIDLVWLLSDLGSNPEYAKSNTVFDTVLYCSPEKAAQGIWPALEPLLMKSKANISDPRHVEVRDRAIQLLTHCRATMLDPEFLTLLAHGSLQLGGQRYAEFRERKLAELNNDERVKVQRGRKLEYFLAQPFFVAEEFNRRPGTNVSLAETIQVTADIMDGKYDAIPEQAFLFVGGIDEVLAKAT